MTSREYKTFQFSVKATDDEQGLIEAYGSVFGIEDQGGDVVKHGAFTRTINNSKARVQAGKSKFQALMLWQHDPSIPIGGWTDLKEDEHGLLCKGQIILTTQQGKEAYELIKGGVINEFSIGYDIPSGGATYDSKEQVRNLTELRLWEVSPVSFAMNQDALLVGVKQDEGLAVKTVCGNTSGEIGPRDESWDGGAAKSWIWKQALDADGNVKAAVAKKYFMRVDGDPSLKGSYGYPFWSNGHINVGGVKAIANALSGARGADAGSDAAGMKAKVKTLYGRINSKYSDDTPLEVPWASDTGKDSGQTREHKTFAEHFAEEMNEDLLEDWQDVFLCALSCAVLDAFKIGDSIEADIEDALTAFHDAVMNWVAQGIEYGLTEYLISQAPEYNPADYTIQYGSESRPDYGRGYMSRRNPLSSKASKAMIAGDATTGGFATEHVSKLQETATKAAKAIESHVAALRAEAEEVVTLIGGADQQTPTSKAGRAFSAGSTLALQDHADALKGLASQHSRDMKRFTKSVNTIADDMASQNQGSQESFADDPGTPDEGRQQGKQRLLRTPFLTRERTRTTQEPRPSRTEEDTVTEDEIVNALGKLKALKRP